MDLAERMIKLSGFKPYIDIEIKIIGLRPGEKLYEELLSDDSKTLPTHHQKIMIAKDEPYEYSLVRKYLEEIELATHDLTDDFVVMKIKQMVPEFISKNSVFEVLDKKVNLKN